MYGTHSQNTKFISLSLSLPAHIAFYRKQEIMAQLWKGRFKKELAKETNDFNASIHFDSRMYKEDITGSMAHATMLGACGIIEKSESEKIVQGLSEILADIESGKLAIDPGAEDIHTFVEGELTARLGQTGKRLHTARSRNDQVALDIRMTLKKEIDAIAANIKDLLAVLCKKAEENKSVILPGYTHLQRAQPITFGHHLMAYAAMLCRDLDRLADVKKRMNVLPLGSGALAGTTYPIDRQMVAAQLGFDDVSANSLDGVSDRDFCIELAAALSLVMVPLSRFSEESIMWCSWEFKFVELDDAKEVYVLTITDKLSGCYNSALQGVMLYEDDHPGEKKIHVFNSLATSGLETLIAYEIRRLADSGLPFEQVVEQVEDYIHNHTALYFCLESLDALKNNGRLFSLAATVIKKLKMKLICQRSSEGTISLAGQDFAAGRAITKMCDLIAKDVEGKDLSRRTMIISHVCCPEKANTIADKVREKCSFGNIIILKASGLNSLYASGGGVIVSYDK